MLILMQIKGVHLNDFFKQVIGYTLHNLYADICCYNLN